MVAANRTLAWSAAASRFLLCDLGSKPGLRFTHHLLMLHLFSARAGVLGPQFDGILMSGKPQNKSNFRGKGKGKKK